MAIDRFPQRRPWANRMAGRKAVTETFDRFGVAMTDWRDSRPGGERFVAVAIARIQSHWLPRGDARPAKCFFRLRGSFNAIRCPGNESLPAVRQLLCRSEPESTGIPLNDRRGPLAGQTKNSRGDWILSLTTFSVASISASKHLHLNLCRKCVNLK